MSWNSASFCYQLFTPNEITPYCFGEKRELSCVPFKKLSQAVLAPPEFYLLLISKGSAWRIFTRDKALLQKFQKQEGAKCILVS